MKRILLLFACLLFAFTAWTQKSGAPNYKTIETEITKSDSPFHYAPLLQRYLKGDSTLTDEECRYVYYGQVFQSGWSPFSLHTPDVKYLMSLSMPDNIDTALAAIKKAENILADDPFNLDILMVAYYLSASDVVQDTGRAQVFSNRIGVILNAIGSSGSGESADEAYHVISISHEYAIAGVMGLNVTSQALVGNCDVLTVKENSFGVEKLYFNITKILEFENRLFGGSSSKEKKEKKSKKNNK